MNCECCLIGKICAGCKGKLYYKNNREKTLLRMKNYRIAHPEILSKTNAKSHQRRKNHPLYKIKHCIREAVRRTCTRVGIKKDCKTFKLLGFTADELLKHKLSFIGKNCSCGIFCNKLTVLTEGNSHCDHIKPLSLAKTIEDVITLNQIENLRWICSSCNISKNDSYNSD